MNYQVEPNLWGKEHKPHCKLNSGINCLVIHTDGICPDKVCTCGIVTPKEVEKSETRCCEQQMNEVGKTGKLQEIGEFKDAGAINGEPIKQWVQTGIKEQALYQCLVCKTIKIV